MQRYVVYFLISLIMSLAAHGIARAASPEDIKKLLEYIIAQSAKERGAIPYGEQGDKVIGVEFVYKDKKYTLAYFPYAKGTKKELPREKQQITVVARKLDWTDAVMVIDTGMDGKPEGYLDILYNLQTKVFRTRRSPLSEGEQQKAYNDIIVAMLEFYEQR